MEKKMENEKTEYSSALIRLLDLFDIGHDFGWYGLTLPIIQEIRLYNEKNPNDKIFITQIKQKWGHLEIYTSKSPEYINTMILKAKYVSEHICEICGERGRLIDMFGCSKTVCDEHLKAWKESLKNSRSEEEVYRELLDSKKYAHKKNKPAKKIWKLRRK